jgi:hypothetical protein
MYVAKGRHLSVGHGVRGKLGVVARKLSKKVTKYELTYNSYPVYTYVGDTGPRQSYGEGCEFKKGVYWELLKASATKASATPVRPANGKGY